MEEKRTDLLALLLRPELPNVQKELPTAEYRVKRLSEALGTGRGIQAEAAALRKG